MQPFRCLLCLAVIEARDVAQHAGLWAAYHGEPDGPVTAEEEPCCAG